MTVQYFRHDGCCGDDAPVGDALSSFFQEPFPPAQAVAFFAGEIDLAEACLWLHFLSSLRLVLIIGSHSSRVSFSWKTYCQSDECGNSSCRASTIWGGICHSYLDII